MKTLYHGTSSRNLSSIKATGLMPGHSKGGDQYAKDHHMSLALLAKHRAASVFLTDEKENAEDFARYAVEEIGGDPILLTFHIPEAVFQTYVVDELFEEDAGTPRAWRTQSVSPSYIIDVQPVEARASFRQLLDELADMLSHA